jgi:hypothetical protein
VTGAPGKTLFADHHDVSSDDESSSGSSGSGGARRQINKAIAQMQVLRMNNAATSSASLGEMVTAATAAARYRRRQGPAGPSPFLRRQSRPLLITELQDIEDILRLPHYAQTGRLHAAAEEVGLDSYRDPANGCIFYTRAFLSQSPCCGEECRHCPYGRVASFTFSAGNFESSETDTSSSSLSSSPPSSRSSSSPSGSETS